MTYMFYFASFVGLLRTLLRPGVLWFLRNPSDPTFNPINEMVCRRARDRSRQGRRSPPLPS